MKIKIFDSIGQEVAVNDLVKIQQKRNGELTFYSRVKIIDGQIFPFSKFCFDRIVKVDNVPSDCKYCAEKKDSGFPEYWMHPTQELHLIDDGKLDKWRMDALMFEHNSFIKVIE